ncbi:uncharacterized protein [Elaeis guineensis]|uniref:uncharacterized protein isoform X1 n=1 Tax=Elaeis guineensis var. tenera TaxID=51953 RepID=UPI00057B3669
MFRARLQPPNQARRRTLVDVAAVGEAPSMAGSLGMGGMGHVVMASGGTLPVSPGRAGARIWALSGCLVFWSPIDAFDSCEAAIDKGQTIAFQLRPLAFQVSHSMFADDLLLIAKVTVRNAHTLRRIMLQYCNRSCGLIIDLILGIEASIPGWQGSIASIGAYLHFIMLDSKLPCDSGCYSGF